MAFGERVAAALSAAETRVCIQRAPGFLSEVRGSEQGAVTYSPTFAVPSAWQGLTSLFGMGRGGALALLPP